MCQVGQIPQKFLTSWVTLWKLKTLGKRKKSFLHPWTMGRVRISSLDHKTVHLDSSNSQYRTYHLLDWFPQVVFLLSFIFILVEFLKNHSKSYKNHKIEKPILLDSIWLELSTEHIIWYTLVQNFFCNFRYILTYN